MVDRTSKKIYKVSIKHTFTATLYLPRLQKSTVFLKKTVVFQYFPVDGGKRPPQEREEGELPPHPSARPTARRAVCAASRRKTATARDRKKVAAKRRSIPDIPAENRGKGRRK